MARSTGEILLPLFSVCMCPHVKVGGNFWEAVSSIHHKDSKDLTQVDRCGKQASAIIQLFPCPQKWHLVENICATPESTPARLPACYTAALEGHTLSSALFPMISAETN